MSSDEGEKVLLGKHGGLGRAGGSTRVTEGKALVWIHLELLVTDRTLQWFFLH